MHHVLHVELEHDKQQQSTLYSPGMTRPTVTVSGPNPPVTSRSKWAKPLFALHVERP